MNRILARVCLGNLLILSLLLQPAWAQETIGFIGPRILTELPTVIIPFRSMASDREADAMFQVEHLSQDVIDQITGHSWTEGSPVKLEDLRLVTVTYLDFQDTAQIGMLLIHKDLSQEVCEIFQELYENSFPIANIGLVEEYDTNDQKSMDANNTYAFFSRQILGTQRYSNHSFGMAIDINPVQNPYLTTRHVYPAAGEAYLDRDNVRPGMIVPGGVCYDTFVSRGWSWGGHWSIPDYQHFEKRIE